MATVVSMGSRGLARNLSNKLIPLVLCAATLAGCYGPFNLTRRVHHWNGHFHENKWPHEGMFLLMIIFPVYGFSFIIDTFIMNSVEFWLDVNPIRPPEDVDGITKTFTNGEQRVVFKRETRAGAPAVVVRLYQADRLVGEFVLARKPDGSTVVRDAAGDVVGEARTLTDGTVVLVDRDGAPRKFSDLDQFIATLKQSQGSTRCVRVSLPLRS